MRLFIGIEIPPEIKEELKKIIGQSKVTGRLRWLDESFWHLTVKFLGEVEGKEVPSLVEKLSQMSRNEPSFSLYLNSIGAFPSDKKPKIVWIQAKGMVSELNTLVNKINEELSPAFSKEDRPFFPHVTLARIKEARSANLMKQILHFDTLAFYRSRDFMINAFHLYQSHLLSQGVRYDILNTFYLGAR